MSEEIKLKPCPFCGSEAELLEDAYGSRRFWFVACHAVSCKIGPHTHRCDTPQEAAELWNRRAGERWPE